MAERDFGVDKGKDYRRHGPARSSDTSLSFRSAVKEVVELTTSLRLTLGSAVEVG